MKKIWYEVHVTVNLLPLGKDVFVQTCKSLGVKSIILDLEHAPHQVAQQDVMTSSKHFGDDQSVFLHMNTLVDTLEHVGFIILRKKIESEPSHHLAPQNLHDVMPDGHYFESHVTFCIQERQRHHLKIIAERNHAHISRNPFKKHEQGLIIMMTLRDYHVPFCLFQVSIDALLQDTQQEGFIPCKKLEVEFAVYDSQMNHDYAWIHQ
jgi:hypothetical protein